MGIPVISSIEEEDRLWEAKDRKREKRRLKKEQAAASSAEETSATTTNSSVADTQDAPNVQARRSPGFY